MRRTPVTLLIAALLSSSMVVPVVAADQPTTILDLLPGVDLVTEEIERGVFAVIDDGAGHELRSPETVEVTSGGTAWVSAGRRLFQLGHAESVTIDDGQLDPVVAASTDGDLMLVSGEDVLRVGATTNGEGEAAMTSEPFGGQGLDLGPASWATAISAAPDGSVWATWSAGDSMNSGATRLIRFDDEGWEDHSDDADLGGLVDLASNTNYICDLASGPAGETWVGVCGAGGLGFFANGLFRYDGSGWERVPAFTDVGRPDVLISDVVAVVAGSDGTTWALVFPTLQEVVDAAAAGDWDWIEEPLTDPFLGSPMLIRHRDGVWSAYRTDHVVPDSEIDWDALYTAGRFMDVDSSGTLWVRAGELMDGSEQLVAFDGETIREYSAVRNIRDLSVDRDGRIWLATREGLRVIDPTMAEAAVRAYDDDVASITPDLLPGVDLVTEEVEPGVHRVLGDGTHDLSHVDDVVITPEGDVYVAENRVDPDSRHLDWGPVYDNQVVRLGQPDTVLQARDANEWSLHLSEDRSPVVFAIANPVLLGFDESEADSAWMDWMGEVDLPDGPIAGPETQASVFRDGRWTPHPHIPSYSPPETEGPCAGWGGGAEDRLVVGDECWIDDWYFGRIRRLAPDWQEPDYDWEDERHIIPATLVGATDDQTVGWLEAGADGTAWAAVRGPGVMEEGEFEGLARYDGSSWSFIPFDAAADPGDGNGTDVPSGPLSILSVAPDGTPWVGLTRGTNELTVATWDGDQWKTHGPVRVFQGDGDQTHFRPDGSVLFLDGRVVVDGTEFGRTRVPSGELSFDQRGNGWKVSGTRLYVITPEAFTPEAVAAAEKRGYAPAGSSDGCQPPVPGAARNRGGRDGYQG